MKEYTKKTSLKSTLFKQLKYQEKGDTKNCKYF